ncbi:thiamine pyrophosphate-binding protein [Candidatus Entotheonella serta]|nr:thiamine pyrophosphate-binding protein [Candidatus Entotheonella serta]
MLAGQVDSGSLGRDRGVLHEMKEQLDVVRPLTKWCQRVTEPAAIPAAIHEAFDHMRSGRPRPTEVEIPSDVLAATTETDQRPWPERAPMRPDAQQIQRVVTLLQQANKPLIWTGGGVIGAEASQELVALAAPVATTTEGRGSIPEDHRLALGVGIFSHGAPTWAMPQADVILAVGTRLTEPVPRLAGLNRPHDGQRLIHLDIDPTVIGHTYPTDVAVVADAREGLQALLDETQQHTLCRSRWPMAELRAIRHLHQQWVRTNAPDQCDILARMQGVLSDDTILVSGVTNLGYWSYYAYCVRQPRTYLTSSYFVTLGFSFPLALGAKIGAQDRPVVALCGDGGFMYALPELATAVQYNINTVTVVFVDDAFGAPKQDQLRRYNRRVTGTELHNPSFADIARSFGAHGVRVTPDRIDEALQEALNEPRPSVIEVPVPNWAPPFLMAPRAA